MRRIKIPIVESRRSAQAKLFDKLPDAAKSLFVAVARLAKLDAAVSIDDIRNLGAFGSTPEIEQLLYALESRGFGKVKVVGAETYFIGNKILMQSVL